MRCTVLLFAQIAESLGTTNLEIDLPDGATVNDALDALARDHDAIRAMRHQLAVAVDAAYRPPTTVLTEQATLALIPPVSGG